MCRLELSSYRTVEGTPDVDLDVVGTSKVAGMDVEVIDPVEVRMLNGLSLGSRPVAGVRGDGEAGVGGGLGLGA